MQCLEEVLSLGEDINFLVVVGHSLIKDVSLGAVIHSFHDLFLSVDNVIWFLFEDMAFEVVFVIRLPRLRTHIAKTFTASAGHKVATHRSLNCLLAPGTYLGILGDPLRICFFLHNLLDPLGFFLAFARVVIIALTPETEYLSAVADYCIELRVDFDAVTAVDSRAKLIVAVGGDEQLA